MIGLWWLVGCHEPAGGGGTDDCTRQPAWVDRDGDGFGDPAGSTDVCPGTAGYADDGDDCDDGDAAVNPSASETCNGIDDDCDGAPDPTSAWYADEDGDGFGGGAVQSACEAPSGFVAEGGDCDDADPTSHPGAAEICGDGHDNDCLGGDESCGGDLPGGDLSDADAKIYALAGDDLGRRLQAGDLDGDGTLDVVATAELANGATGGAYVLLGPVLGTEVATDAGYAARGSSTLSAAGRSLGIGDVDADGYQDLEIGVPFSTHAYLQLGPVTASFDLVDASIVLDGSGATLFGHGSDVADVNGDDVEDVLVGAYQYDGEAPTGGAVFLAFGPLTSGTIALVDDADVVLYGSTDSLQAGRVVAAGGDMDGDGIADVVTQATGYAGGAPACGAVLVAHGPFPADLDLADTDATLVGVGTYSYAGTGLAQGDVDGDGLADALVGAPNASSGGAPDGDAYVVSGPTVGVVDLATADVVVHGTAGGSLGASLSAGDLDGDGQPELVLGAPYEESGKGALYVFVGAMPGSLTDTDAALRIAGENAPDQAGASVLLADLDEDGAVDLVTGAPSENTGGSYGGAVYFMLSD